MKNLPLSNIFEVIQFRSGTPQIRTIGIASTEADAEILRRRYLTGCQHPGYRPPIIVRMTPTILPTLPTAPAVHSCEKCDQPYL